MSKCIVHDYRGYKHPDIPLIDWLSVPKEDLERIAEKELEQFKKEAAVRKAKLVGQKDADQCMRDARYALLDGVLLDPGILRAETGVDTLPYFYMVARVKWALQDPFAPLVRDGIDEFRASWKGNRCNVLAVHMPLLLLYKRRTGCPQEVLQSKFGIDQTTISRYLDMIQTFLTESSAMPTVHAVAEEVATKNIDETIELIGHVLNGDVTEFEIEAPGDKKSNDAAFSGKAKTTTAKSIFLCSAAGLLVAMGDILPGRKHDIVALRETLPFLGDLTRSIEKPCEESEKRFTINFDRGMTGAAAKLKGADVRIPAKREKGQKRLPEKLRKEKYEIDSERSIIENVFRRMKVYREIGGVFRGSIADLESSVVFITGVVNLQLIMGCIDPDRSRRNGRRPGPKTPHSPGRKPRETFG